MILERKKILAIILTTLICLIIFVVWIWNFSFGNLNFNLSKQAKQLSENGQDVLSDIPNIPQEFNESILGSSNSSFEEVDLNPITNFQIFEAKSLTTNISLLKVPAKYYLNDQFFRPLQTFGAFNTYNLSYNTELSYFLIDYEKRNLTFLGYQVSLTEKVNIDDEEFWLFSVRDLFGNEKMFLFDQEFEKLTTLELPWDSQINKIQVVGGTIIDVEYSLTGVSGVSSTTESYQIKTLNRQEVNLFPEFSIGF